MKFPRKESDILRLAQEMVTGFDAHTDIYPAPLVSAADLTTDVDAYHAARGAEMTARAEWEKTVTAKNEILQTLIENMKRDIRYAKNIVDFDDAQLRLIGWGGRKPRQSLPPPGQVRSLEIAAQDEGSITLDWKAPNEGGAVAAYRVERSESPCRGNKMGGNGRHHGSRDFDHEAGTGEAVRIPGAGLQ
uniref:Fibronectin type III domain-containing protein n=1 Tax=Candidatus Kentrum sp. LPFa TaxID=2126335 RepID=A0A450XR10_9GAMM|nr:MAG: hypothetical protein BECKLPF1236A_GA0070988_1013110 [Candidatus Kentron sp. LPFa]VFK31724.1 MAG: hypothetical protein BECKLPF1236C_GA0070990_101479 [Candidatus Kentron sp. LPFa]